MQSFKNFWSRFCSLAESFGRARAATSLARHGHYQLARDIMLQKSECR